jgi:predicted nuclease of restriction endonuclease-like RecB superfamily
MNPKMNPPTKRTAQSTNPNENSLAKRLQREKDDRVQRDADDHGSEKCEEAKDAPLPKHGKRLFIEASIFWQNEYGKNRHCQGKFLVDSECTGGL